MQDIYDVDEGGEEGFEDSFSGTSVNKHVVWWANPFIGAFPGSV